MKKYCISSKVGNTKLEEVFPVLTIESTRNIAASNKGHFDVGCPAEPLGAF